MEDYISREKALGIVCKHCDQPDNKDLCPYKFTGCHLYYDMFEFPAADVVSRDAFNRILEENDTMREQMAAIGKKPGDKMDDVMRVEEANLILIKRGKNPFILFECSGCRKRGWFGDDTPKYCVNCGAKFNKTKMDGGEAIT